MIDSMMQRRYVKTATDEPPSLSDDSTSDGYLTYGERKLLELFMAFTYSNCCRNKIWK